MVKDQYPDFRELNDRVIAEHPKGPFLSIKTNLDSDDPLSENPYLNEEASEAEKAKLRSFFSDSE